MKGSIKVAILGAALAASSSLAFATPITPGTTVAPSVIAINATPANTVAKTSGTLAPTGPLGATYSGTYQETVFKDSTNTLCGTAGSCLTFVILINDQSGDAIETVANGAFGSGFLLNVGYATQNGINGQLVNPTEAPTSVTDSVNGVINFSFGNTGIPAGDDSDFLVIQTSATNYTAGVLSTQDNSVASMSGYVAAAATPEPSSLMLLGTGLLGAAGVAFRKRSLV